MLLMGFLLKRSREFHGTQAIDKVGFSPIERVFYTGTLPGGQNFERKGWVTLEVTQVQNSIITTGVLISEPDKTISAIYLAICLKNANMSVLEFQ